MNLFLKNDKKKRAPFFLQVSGEMIMRTLYST